jgi:tetratricopeptide (TPR) repeat protein
VAGIIVDASEGQAQLHTLAVAFAEESRRPLGADTATIIDDLVNSGKEPEEVLHEYRERLLAHMSECGRTSSRYLQATGAGVVNLSFGGGMEWWQGYAMNLARRTVDHLQELDEEYPADYDALEPLAIHWGREMYVANAVEVARMAYENPDVLFCCAAGNEDSKNDDTMVYPAYLSRFFPNVITVASVGENDRISGFSNFGVLSVNVSAPGENILSTVIPEASMYMDGTSMATPHVAGVAAFVRAIAPEISATDLRRELEYTVRETPQLHLFTSSGGVVDKDMLRALHTGDKHAQSNAFATMAINVAQVDDALYPRHQADADRYSKKAIELDAQNAEAWRARAAYFDIIGQPEQAWAPIEKATKLAPDSMMVAVSRAIILEHRNLPADAAAILDRIITSLESSGADANLRARRLAWRARLLLQAGRTSDAVRDARAARALNENVQLPEDLEAQL